MPGSIVGLPQPFSTTAAYHFASSESVLGIPTWPRYRLNGKRIAELLEGVAKPLAELVTLLAGVGFIIGALSVTGLAGAPPAKVGRQPSDRVRVVPTRHAYQTETRS